MNNTSSYIWLQSLGFFFSLFLKNPSFNKLPHLWRHGWKRNIIFQSFAFNFVVFILEYKQSSVRMLIFFIKCWEKKNSWMIFQISHVHILRFRFFKFCRFILTFTYHFTAASATLLWSWHRINKMTDYLIVFGFFFLDGTPAHTPKCGKVLWPFKLAIQCGRTTNWSITPKWIFLLCVMLRGKVTIISSYKPINPCHNKCFNYFSRLC